MFTYICVCSYSLTDVFLLCTGIFVSVYMQACRFVVFSSVYSGCRCKCVQTVIVICGFLVVCGRSGCVKFQHVLYKFRLSQELFFQPRKSAVMCAASLGAVLDANTHGD